MGNDSGERLGMELRILRVKHHQELGVEWRGWVMIFFFKKTKTKTDAKSLLHKVC